MGPVKVGIVGLGKIAEQVHLPGLASSPHAEIYAVCTTNVTRLRLIGERYRVPPERRFQNFMDLVQLPELQAVDIATPNFAHLEPAVAAYRHGKHVCIEKPVAMSYPQALEIETHARAAGTTTMVCFSYRFVAAARFAKWIIDEGGIGRVLTVYIQYLKSAAFDRSRGLEWRFQKELAGSGVLGDLGSHMVDMTRFLVGEITSVCSTTGIAVPERRRLDSGDMGRVSTDDCCTTIALLAAGGHANIAVSRCALGLPTQNSVKVAVYGDQGMVRFDTDRPLEIEACSGTLDSSTGSYHTYQVPASFSAEQMDCFARSVMGDTDRYIPVLGDGVRCQKILDAMIASDTSRTWVDV
jgi:predicted dehydrogenase